jgi:hypothetical protein
MTLEAPTPPARPCSTYLICTVTVHTFYNRSTHCKIVYHGECYKSSIAPHLSTRLHGIHAGSSATTPAVRLVVIRDCRRNHLRRARNCPVKFDILAATAVDAGRGFEAARPGESSLSPPIQSYPCICYHSRVVAALNKSHHLLAGARHLSSPGFRLRVLLKLRDRVAVEHEGYLSKPPRPAPVDGREFGGDFHDVGLLQQSPSPHCGPKFIAGTSHFSWNRSQSHFVDYTVNATMR